MMRVVKQWHRFPGEVVDAPFPETIKARLDRSLSYLVELKMSLLMAGVLGYRIFKYPLQVKSSDDAVKSRNRAGKL